MIYEAEDRPKVRRQQTELAIQLAMQSRWEEAVRVNRAIISLFPADVDAFNRLGKALTELGRYKEARDAYSKALELDSHNTIARKNLSRLATLGEEAERREAAHRLSPEMFIEETGKTGVTILLRPNLEVAARLTAGDQVFLHRENGNLSVRSPEGDYMGEIDPRLAQRLIKLIDGGNQYVAALTALSESGDIKIIVRETYQHPSQAGKLSFPPTATETFRPYVKERLLRPDEEEEEYFDESDDGEEWDQTRDADAEVSEVTIYQVNPEAPDVAAVEDEEE